MFDGDWRCYGDWHSKGPELVQCWAPTSQFFQSLAGKTVVHWTLLTFHNFWTFEIGNLLVKLVINGHFHWSYHHHLLHIWQRSIIVTMWQMENYPCTKVVGWTQSGRDSKNFGRSIALAFWLSFPSSSRQPHFIISDFVAPRYEDTSSSSWWHLVTMVSPWKVFPGFWSIYPRRNHILRPVNWILTFVYQIYQHQTQKVLRLVNCGQHC